MYSNYSNNGFDSFPFGSGSFRPASRHEEDDIISSEMRDRLPSASGNGFMSWVRQILQH